MNGPFIEVCRIASLDLNLCRTVVSDVKSNDATAPELLDLLVIVLKSRKYGVWVYFPCSSYV